MPDMTSKAMFARLFPILGLVLLGACHVDVNGQNPITLVTSHTFDHANWRQYQPNVEPQVEPVTVVHPVEFESGRTELSEDEMERLRAFLQDSGVHQGARIEIDGPRGRGGYFDPVTAARVAEIESELSSIGLRSQIPSRPTTSLMRPEGAIAVSVTQAMVIQPDCGAPQPEAAERPAYIHSCSNAAALGLMIANPVDLERGRDEGPADGERAALSIRDYRKGKTKGLIGSGL